MKCCTQDSCYQTTKIKWRLQPFSTKIHPVIPLVKRDGEFIFLFAAIIKQLEAKRLCQSIANQSESVEVTSFQLTQKACVNRLVNQKLVFFQEVLHLAF